MCGCVSPVIMRAAGGSDVSTGSPGEITLADQRHDILARIAHDRETSAEMSTWRTQVVDGFLGEMNGDYYDVLNAEGIIRIGIGDVTGHGLESGVLMLMPQTAIRTLIEHGETDPVRFLETVNRILYKNLQRMKVDKTLTLAFVNYQDNNLKIVGQHEELLVVRQGGQIERVDTINLGFPLGLEEHIAEFVAEATVALQSGESVVLYTDGITETENMDKQFYGIERLCDVLRQHWRLSAEAMKQAIVDDVTSHIGQQQVFDDLILVILKQK
jgi:phosphoserine phosphatase RsbU/P